MCFKVWFWESESEVKTWRRHKKEVTYMEMGGRNVAKISHKWRSLLSSMSSCGFHRIPTGKSEFRRIPWNFYGKHLAGASAIWVSISMEIPTFSKEFRWKWSVSGSLQEWFPMESMGFHWNSAGIPWETALKSLSKIVQLLKSNTRVCNTSRAGMKQRSCGCTMWPLEAQVQTSLIPVVTWPRPKWTSAFADVWFGHAQQQTVVVFQPPPSLPSMTCSAARRPQPPPLSSTIDITQPMTHDHTSPHHDNALCVQVSSIAPPSHLLF